MSHKSNEEGAYARWRGRPTLTARQWNPAIKPFFERLTAAGKPFKLAMTACIRKLLTIINTLLKNAVPWKNLSAT